MTYDVTWMGLDDFPPATLHIDLTWTPDPAALFFKYGADEATEAGGKVIYEAIGLPFGVVIHSATGALSGRPRQAGEFNVSVLARKVSMAVNLALDFTTHESAVSAADLNTPLG